MLATITVRLNMPGDSVSKTVIDALHNLADVMLVQAEDGLYTLGSPDAEDLYDGDTNLVALNDHLLSFEGGSTTVEVSA